MQKVEIFGLMDKMVAKMKNGDVLLSMCAKIAVSEEYLKEKLGDINYKNESDFGFKPNQAMVYPNLEKD